MRSSRCWHGHGSAPTTDCAGCSTYADDVQWHDGTPLTAHDVEFTFNRVIYNDDFQASSRASFEFRSFNAETGQWEQSQMTVAHWTT